MNQETPKPDARRFTEAAPVSGTVVYVEAIVERCEYRAAKRYSFSPYALTGPRYMRLRVLVRTDEGWTLAGKIGKALDNASVPDVRVGDRIQVEPITLSRAEFTREQRAKGIYTPKTLCRTLRGKVVRARA